MKFKGVTYDFGYVMDENWRPSFDMKVVHRELEILKNYLYCNAVRICGFDTDRLMKYAEDALEQGLHVWLSPNSSGLLWYNYSLVRFVPPVFPSLRTHLWAVLHQPGLLRKYNK